MKPPMCLFCLYPPRGDRKSERFTLVYFRQTVEPDDWEGHPENAVWFCDDHAPLAEGLTGLTADEAMRQIWNRIRSA
ncbi:hypothetical protein [Streptomyces sp. NPDC012510]|uniref:hypothetical protein n=1 Tax=Streptomyces sp. NPDC012510 TaxID=3364838 RepID=UPI0036F11141